MSIFRKLFRRKRTRYQCTDCKKTFYKLAYELITISHTDTAELPCCPYCKGGYIKV